jgi:hypothetical protein
MTEMLTMIADLSSSTNSNRILDGLHNGGRFYAWKAPAGLVQYLDLFAFLQAIIGSDLAHVWRENLWLLPHRHRRVSL